MNTAGISWGFMGDWKPDQLYSSHWKGYHSEMILASIGDHQHKAVSRSKISEWLVCQTISMTATVEKLEMKTRNDK